MILNGVHLIKRAPVSPMAASKYLAHGVSFGLTEAGYDLRIKQTVILHPLRLFEIGRTIPHVAAVSGHLSWTSLRRYTHIRQTGDCWAGVGWLETVTR